MQRLRSPGLTPPAACYPKIRPTCYKKDNQCKQTQEGAGPNSWSLLVAIPITTQSKHKSHFLKIMFVPLNVPERVT